jgi:hypothetical protein
MSGFAVSATKLGMPDAQLITYALASSITRAFLGRYFDAGASKPKIESV